MRCRVDDCVLHKQTMCNENESSYQVQFSGMTRQHIRYDHFFHILMTKQRLYTVIHCLCMDYIYDIAVTALIWKRQSGIENEKRV